MSFVQATVRSPLTSQPLLVPCVAPAGRVLGSRRPVHRSLRAMAGQDGRQPWDLGRFARTVFFFNEPPSLDSVRSLAALHALPPRPCRSLARLALYCFPIRCLPIHPRICVCAPQTLFSSLVTALTGAPASPAPVAAADTGGREGGELVLVVGATGGVGKRVVELLRAQGVPVRALVRNLDKAQSLLGEDVDVVAADVTQMATLQPAFFRGVTAVVNACAVTVGPKEGDTADRQKYYQVRPPAPLPPAQFFPALWLQWQRMAVVGRGRGAMGGIKFYDPQASALHPSHLSALLLCPVAHATCHGTFQFLKHSLIIGDTPEAVEYTGVANLLARLRPQLAAAAGCHTIFSLTGARPPPPSPVLLPPLPHHRCSSPLSLTGAPPPSPPSGPCHGSPMSCSHSFHTTLPSSTPCPHLLLHSHAHMLTGEPVGALWGALDDVVMGGVSESALQYDKTAGEGGLPAALFTGNPMWFPCAPFFVPVLCTTLSTGALALGP
ncbi:unnamed protein product [Closterium sp. Naga37s-1]|nr:unnamed protein product [Closterium sp. Naga37s-1]